MVLVAWAGLALLYLRTMPPGLTLGDAGDFAVAAHQFGVPHPTGYPLYTLLSALWIRLIPWGEVAWRMNLLSVVCAVAACGLLYAAVRKLLATRRGAFLAGGLLALTPTFWVHAIITEVYALHMLLWAALLLALLRYAEDPIGRRGVAVALVFGLMLTHHLTSVWLLPGMAVYLWLIRRRRSDRPSLKWAWLALVPLALYVYLPVAALRDPPWNWGDPRTPRRFLMHVTGDLYRDKMTGATTVSMGQRLAGYAGMGKEGDFAAPAQFSWVLLWLAPVGLIALWRQRRHSSVLLLLWYAATLAWALAYAISDIEAYFLVPHAIMALWIAAGFESVVSGLGQLRPFRSGGYGPRLLAWASGVLAVGSVAVMAMANYSGVDLSQDRSADNLGRGLLKPPGENALLVLSGDTWGFPAVYHHYVNGLRPDVRFLFYRDFLHDEYRRLVLRERERGLTIPDPVGTGSDAGMQWLRRIIEANQRTRPCYLVGAAFLKMHEEGTLEPTLGPVRQRAPSLPVFACLPR